MIKVRYFLVINRCVELGVEAQRFGRSLDKEGEESQLGVLALNKCVLCARTQSGNLCNVYFNDGGELGGGCE